MTSDSLGSQKIKNSYKIMFFTTKLFVANLLKHLRSCQFTGYLVGFQFKSSVKRQLLKTGYYFFTHRFVTKTRAIPGYITSHLFIHHILTYWRNWLALIFTSHKELQTNAVKKCKNIPTISAFSCIAVLSIVSQGVITPKSITLQLIRRLTVTGYI